MSIIGSSALTTVLLVCLVATTTTRANSTTDSITVGGTESTTETETAITMEERSRSNGITRPTTAAITTNPSNPSDTYPTRHSMGSSSSTTLPSGPSSTLATSSNVSATIVSSSTMKSTTDPNDFETVTHQPASVIMSSTTWQPTLSETSVMETSSSSSSSAAAAMPNSTASPVGSSTVSQTNTTTTTRPTTAAGSSSAQSSPTGIFTIFSTLFSSGSSSTRAWRTQPMFTTRPPTTPSAENVTTMSVSIETATTGSGIRTSITTPTSSWTPLDYLTNASTNDDAATTTVSRSQTRNETTLAGSGSGLGTSITSGVSSELLGTHVDSTTNSSGTATADADHTTTNAPGITNSTVPFTLPTLLMSTPSYDQMNSTPTAPDVNSLLTTRVLSSSPTLTATATAMVPLVSYVSSSSMGSTASVTEEMPMSSSSSPIVVSSSTAADAQTTPVRYNAGEDYSVVDRAFTRFPTDVSAVSTTSSMLSVVSSSEVDFDDVDTFSVGSTRTEDGRGSSSEDGSSGRLEAVTIGNQELRSDNGDEPRSISMKGLDKYRDLRRFAVTFVIAAGNMTVAHWFRDVDTAFRKLVAVALRGGDVSQTMSKLVSSPSGTAGPTSTVLYSAVADKNHIVADLAPSDVIYLDPTPIRAGNRFYVSIHVKNGDEHKDQLIAAKLAVEIIKNGTNIGFFERHIFGSQVDEIMAGVPSEVLAISETGAGKTAFETHLPLMFAVCAAVAVFLLLILCVMGVASLRRRSRRTPGCDHEKDQGQGTRDHWNDHYQLGAAGPRHSISSRQKDSASSVDGMELSCPQLIGGLNLAGDDECMRGEMDEEQDEESRSGATIPCDSIVSPTVAGSKRAQQQHPNLQQQQNRHQPSEQVARVNNGMGMKTPSKSAKQQPAASPHVYKDWPTPLQSPQSNATMYCSGGSPYNNNDHVFVKETNTRL